MDFIFQTHIHHIVVHDQLVIFDEKKDLFSILSKLQTTTLIIGNKHCERYRTLYDHLLSLNIITRQNGFSQTLRKAQENYTGIDNYTWRADERIRPKNIRPLSILRACLDLVRLKSKFMRHGFEAILNDMRTSKQHLIKTVFPPTFNELENYANDIYIASLILPFKIKCLESSICVFNHTIKSGKTCDFIIGIQLFDFLSHAWIEVDGKVVADKNDLSTKLPIILKI